MDLATAGVEYLTAGLRIIALDGKKPNGAVHPHGLKDAFILGEQSKETGETFDLWRQASLHKDTTGVGIVIPPWTAVIDIDGEKGAVAFRQLAPSLPETAYARTARGMHAWFHAARIVRSTKLAEQLDLK